MNLSELTQDWRPHDPRRRRHAASADAGADHLIRLWALRILVPLGGWARLLEPARLTELDAGVCELLGLRGWMKRAFGDALPEAETLRRELPARLRRAHATAEKDTAQAHPPLALQVNLAHLAELMGLVQPETDLIGFVVLLHGDGRLRACAELLGPLTLDRVFASLARILALPEEAVRAGLATHSSLNRSGLLSLDRSQASLLASSLQLNSYGFAQRMLSEQRDPLDIFRDAITPCPPPQLALADYVHIAADLAVLRPYLRLALGNGRAGVNVLIHGAPGTGKSQLVRVLAADLGGALYEVASEDEDGEPSGGLQRLRALFAAQRLVGRRRALILFDEIEDVFNDAGEGRKSTAQLRKAWMNRMLEQNPVPTLWISNRVDGLDAAFIRRFDLVLELPVPPRRQRERLIRDLAGGFVDDHAIHRLAGAEQLAPAVLARAAAVLHSVGDDLSASERPAAFARLIEQTLTAQGHRSLPATNQTHNAGDYDPAFANCDADLAALADGLTHARAGRLCLFGPPGTGKTAFGRWLAERLDAPLHVRAVSDLVSAYVGETEQAIAHAFREAEREGAVLLIDEVDSFLRDRQTAQRGWEVTQVNEMLTRMEQFPGLFIATTNLMRDLDPAALRRFDLKLRFDWLRPNQASELLRRLCTRLGLAAPESTTMARLAHLPQLTPGDFAAVARQHRFRPFADASSLLDALEAECALKPEGAARRVGFV